MSRSILIVFLFALLQLVAGGKGYGFGGVAIADTFSKASVGEKYGKGKYGKGFFSKALASGTGIAVGPNAQAFSASDAVAGKGFAKASSVAAASVSGGKYYKDCKKDKCDDDYYYKDCKKEKCDKDYD